MGHGVWGFRPVAMIAMFQETVFVGVSGWSEKESQSDQKKGEIQHQTRAHFV
jgi:hypothetical protein